MGKKEGQVLDLPNQRLFAPELIRGEDDEDTELLRKDHGRARDWLESHRRWCSGVTESWFVAGVAGVFTVHLFRVTTLDPSIPELLWVFYGDVPPAYLPVEDAPSLAAATTLYLGECEEWARRAEAGLPVDDVMPVATLPTAENARGLRSRVRFIREELLNEEGVP